MSLLNNDFEDSRIEMSETINSRRGDMSLTTLFIVDRKKGKDQRRKYLSSKKELRHTKRFSSFITNEEATNCSTSK